MRGSLAARSFCGIDTTAKQANSMTPPTEFTDVDFAGKGTYRIVVQGTLTEEWSNRMAGLAIRINDRGQAPTHTTLLGEISDQAQLVGVLAALYGLHLPILKVERIPNDSERSM